MAGQSGINQQERLAAAHALVAIDRQPGLRQLKAMLAADRPDASVRGHGGAEG
jgi:hypothetical protein